MFWEIMCIAYFIGGITFGWWLTIIYQKKKYKSKSDDDSFSKHWDERKFYGEGDQ